MGDVEQTLSVLSLEQQAKENEPVIRFANRKAVGRVSRLRARRGLRALDLRALFEKSDVKTFKRDVGGRIKQALGDAEGFVIINDRIRSWEPGS